MPRIIATTGIEPAGTPAVPMPPRMQISTTVDLLGERQVDAVELGQEQHRDALEQRGAVLVGGRADGQDEAADVARQLEVLLGDLERRGQRGVDEAVEKAVSIASWMPRKNASGLMPPSKRTASE